MEEWVLVVMNKIIISPLNGVETRMCFCIDGNDIENCNVAWQILIHPEQQLRDQMFIKIDMKEVLTRMNASISSPTAVDCDWLFNDTTDRGFDNQLYAIDLRKFLPSAILRTIVTDVKEKTQEG